MKKIFKDAGLDLSDELIEEFEVLYQAYERWQNRINFTAIKDKKSFVVKLFVGSIWPLESLDLSKSKTLLDIGTGGGFPGLPIAICKKNIRVFLNDSVKKKLDMIADIRSHLSINNIVTLCDRVENLGQNSKYRESFDVVTAQALAKWNTALELCLPLVKVGGQFWAYQSPRIYSDLKKIDVVKKLGGEIAKIEKFELPYEMGKRILVVVNKIESTPRLYPRAAGLPKKRPLIDR